MEYRVLGKTGLSVSTVSLGTEYIWHAPYEQVKEVIDASLEGGINYIDLFMGSDEVRANMGQALKGRRDQVILAGHLGCADQEGQYWKTRDMDVVTEYIERFYRLVQTDVIDILFLHNCDTKEDSDTIFQGPMYQKALELKALGRAKWIGLSSHNTKVAMEAVSKGLIDVLMFPVNPIYNLLPRDRAHERMKGNETEEVLTEAEKAAYPSVQALYRLCKERQVGIVGMKPYAAGNLLEHFVGGNLKGLLTLSPVQCIAYALDQMGVTCALPGMKNRQEVEEALAYFQADAKARSYQALLEQSDLYRFYDQCMYCNHCQPCPAGLDIAMITKYKDLAEKNGRLSVQEAYQALKQTAKDCISCGGCTRRCPFGVAAEENIHRAQALFGC